LGEGEEEEGDGDGESEGGRESEKRGGRFVREREGRGGESEEVARERAWVAHLDNLLHAALDLLGREVLLAPAGELVEVAVHVLEDHVQPVVLPARRRRVLG
jgi:hypothetical protein